MAISRLETQISTIHSEPIKRKQQEPLKMDLIHLGTEVLTYLAEKRGLSYDEATAPRRSLTCRTKVQGQILDDYMKVAMAVPLPLTSEEHAIVMKSSVRGINVRVNRILRDTFGLKVR